jgi:hypothetical protein
VLNWGRASLHRRQFLAALAPPRQCAQPWTELVAAKSPVRTPLLGLLFTRQRVGALGLRDWGVCAQVGHLAGEGVPQARQRRRELRMFGRVAWGPLDPPGMALIRSEVPVRASGSAPSDQNRMVDTRSRVH